MQKRDLFDVMEETADITQRVGVVVVGAGTVPYSRVGMQKCIATSSSLKAELKLLLLFLITVLDKLPNGLILTIDAKMRVESDFQPRCFLLPCAKTPTVRLRLLHSTAPFKLTPINKMKISKCIESNFYIGSVKNILEEGKKKVLKVSL